MLQSGDNDAVEGTACFWMSISVSVFVASGFECSLRNSQVNQYLDRSTRTWHVDATALDDVEHDLQSIVNCTLEGDLVLFDVTETIRLATRVTIPWRLTLSANVDSNDTVDGVFLRSLRKATFRCPSRNGVFFVRWTCLLRLHIVSLRSVDPEMLYLRTWHLRTVPLSPRTS